MRRSPLILAALVLLSLIASIAAQEPGSDSPTPSITNQGPRGLAVLATWLSESGVPVLAHDAPLTQLPAETGVLVLAAPSGAELRVDEVDRLKTFVERGTTLLFQHAGGAIARVATDATAFAQRKAIANMLFFVDWPLTDSPDGHIDYIRKAWGALEPFTDGWYSNEVDNHSATVVNSNYQGNYPRLVEIKKRYDPGNLFRLNANITPPA